MAILYALSIDRCKCQAALKIWSIKFIDFRAVNFINYHTHRLMKPTYVKSRKAYWNKSGDCKNRRDNGFKRRWRTFLKWLVANSAPLTSVRARRNVIHYALMATYVLLPSTCTRARCSWSPDRHTERTIENHEILWKKKKRN